MNHDLKKPCPECPFVGKWKGWIGSHESAQDFVDIARADGAFPCHMSVDQEIDQTPGEIMADDTVAQCAGQALFMNKMCKLSRDPRMAAMQNRLRAECQNVEVLWPPQKLVAHHGK